MHGINTTKLATEKCGANAIKCTQLFKITIELKNSKNLNDSG
jgi:hypothetical protein